MTLNAAGKLAPACPKCGQEHPNVTPEDFQSGKPLPAVAIVRPKPVLVQDNPSPEVLPLTYAAPIDVIQSVRDRIVFLGADEARLDGVLADTQARLAGVRVESKKLRKMLSAADREDRQK